MSQVKQHGLCGDGRWRLVGATWYGRGDWGCRRPYWTGGDGGWTAIARVPVWFGGPGWYAKGAGYWDVGSVLEADVHGLRVTDTGV